MAVRLALVPAGSSPLLLAAALGLVVLFVVLFAWQCRLRNAALVDVGWAGSLGLLALLYAATGTAPPWRRWLLAGTVGAWSTRLVVHLVRDRVLPGVEEGRYQALRAWLGPRADAWFLPFFLAQAALSLALSLPFLAVAHHRSAGVAATEVLGALLALGAVLGESLADRQLARFKADPTTAGTVCRRGLWARSRHPNYFFEWLVWCGFALLATSAPGGGWAWLAPALLFVLVRWVTGVPPTERRALRSRGEAYRRYQLEVPALVPWPWGAR